MSENRMLDRKFQFHGSSATKQRDNNDLNWREMTDFR